MDGVSATVTHGAQGIRHNARGPILGLALCALWLACAPSAPPLGNAQPSLDALACRVLNAIERRDAAALRALALDEQEFRTYVWPHLPAARPQRNLPFSYVWGDLHQKSEMELSRTLAEYGGRRHALISVAAEGEATSYPGVVVRRDTVLRVRGESGDAAIRVFGSTIQSDEGWKVFSYVVDD